MKKFLAMALTGAMCVGLLAGCSNGSSGTTSAPSGGSSASTPSATSWRWGPCQIFRRLQMSRREAAVRAEIRRRPRPEPQGRLIQRR